MNYGSPSGAASTTSGSGGGMQSGPRSMTSSSSSGPHSAPQRHHMQHEMHASMQQHPAMMIPQGGMPMQLMQYGRPMQMHYPYMSYGPAAHPGAMMMGPPPTAAAAAPPPGIPFPVQQPLTATGQPAATQWGVQASAQQPSHSHSNSNSNSSTQRGGYRSVGPREIAPQANGNDANAGYYGSGNEGHYSKGPRSGGYNQGADGSGSSSSSSDPWNNFNSGPRPASHFGGNMRQRPNGRSNMMGGSAGYGGPAYAYASSDVGSDGMPVSSPRSGMGSDGPSSTAPTPLAADPGMYPQALVLPLGGLPPLMMHQSPHSNVGVDGVTHLLRQATLKDQ